MLYGPHATTFHLGFPKPPWFPQIRVGSSEVVGRPEARAGPQGVLQEQRRTHTPNLPPTLPPLGKCQTQHSSPTSTALNSMDSTLLRPF